MKKKILSTMLVTAAVATLGITGAQAGSLNSVAGPVKFLYDAFDAAQNKYTRSCGGAAVALGIADCDAASSPSDAPMANQPNDTYGLAEIANIKENIFGGNILWSDGTAGESLVAYFYGFQDYDVNFVSAGQSNILSSGGHVDIYRVADNFLTTINTTSQATIESDLALVPTKYLTLDFVPGCLTGNTDATLCGQFNLATLTGNSDGFATATGGTAATKYPNLFHFEQSVTPCGFSTVCPTGSAFNITVNSSSATTVALPEPGTLGLLGLGLVGLGLVGRRRKVA